MIKILYFFFMVLSFDLIIGIKPVIHVCAKRWCFDDLVFKDKYFSA